MNNCREPGRRGKKDREEKGEKRARAFSAWQEVSPLSTCLGVQPVRRHVQRGTARGTLVLDAAPLRGQRVHILCWSEVSAMAAAGAGDPPRSGEYVQVRLPSTCLKDIVVI